MFYSVGRNCVQLQEAGYAANWFNVAAAKTGRPPTLEELQAHLEGRVQELEAEVTRLTRKK
jgi:hypothetical protein